MKRIIVYSVLIVLNIALGVYGMNHKVLEYPSSDILGVTYYKYNSSNGGYDTLIVTKENIKYSGNEFNLNNCNSYEYTEVTNIVKMDCGRAFRLINPNNNLVVVSIDNANYYFYKSREDSYTKEFNTKFDMTINDYEFEGKEKLESIALTKEEFDELLTSEETSFVYTRLNNCENECILFAGSMDKLSANNNVYYLDFTSLEDETIASIENIDSGFKNSTSPKILVISDGEIKDVITVNILGFNVDKLVGLLDDYKLQEKEEEDTNE